MSISIHAPPRGATYANALMAFDIEFQFTPLREGRPHSLSLSDAGIYYFNSRPSARGDDARTEGVENGCYFNSRPSARGDDVEYVNYWQIMTISIHAPPRGATKLELIGKIVNKFQFTPLREGRRGSNDMWRSAVHISIHAPPRGATRDARGQRHARRYFNSRPSARGDANPLLPPMRLQIISIHAPPRGATEPPSPPSGRCRYFNSRPSARGDRDENAFSPPDFISIHAPPRGATEISDKMGALWNISIHAPPRGATANFSRENIANLLFQFTPLREGRRYGVQVRAMRHEISIHAPPRGATPRRI